MNLSRPEASLAKDFKVIELRNNGAEAQRLMYGALSSTQRSVYLPLVRNITPTSLDVFDFATQGMVTGSRDTTTVATQALYLLNDPFVRRQSLALAARLLSQSDRDDAARVNLAYQLVLNRTATSAETQRALSYLTDYSSAAGEEQSPTLAQTGRKPGKTPKAPAPRPETTTNATVASNDADASVQPDEITKDDVIAANDPQHAAWISLCQALLGTAEFRYVR